MKLLILAAAAFLGLASVSAGVASADIAKGKKNFSKCAACHSLEAGKNGLGPTLHKIFGRKAAAEKGFKYSKGMTAAAAKGLVWDRKHLMGYLKHPRKFLKKYLGVKKVSNKMANRFKKKKFRKAVVDYLESLNKK